MTDIRDARAIDAEGVAAVQVASWRAAYRGLIPDDVLERLSVEERAVAWAARVRTPLPGTSILVAKVDGAVVGFVAVGTEGLRALYVHPGHWREGIGSLLHAEAVDRLGLLGCTVATLWTLEGNDRALAFYTRCGWVDTGQRQVDPGPEGVPLHEMRLRFTGPLRPAFVPADFTVPPVLDHPSFRLEPLAPDHNDADLAAWTGSIPHIRATPGFTGRNWPPESGMSREANLADLTKHAADFVRRIGFTYTVLDPGTRDVIGCVYIYPSPGADASVRSWVRADRAELDPVLHAAVTDWLRTSWPFGTVDYAPRRD
ncbi:MAG: GNAT family N-acetyltransferase [Pseudonocardia sp.]|uniref:GNAT family N-acetyltransferase n=1 Tax=Pseudonocardia sp. TaxID=60912 RepID=UPI001AD18B03|nr:GNAT family N-acetyltransferase [Pseudonocardia sp.]MBN9096829.1 GNAT family N-acetyltransferase [Pseudonocardia sp.]